MVKKNKLLIGCLSLLLVLSVGYALFSETVTINGTATAKGSFGVTTTCVPGISNELVQLGFATTPDDLQKGFENDSCVVEGNKITANSDLIYPGARRFFTIKMTNNNSIPAIIWGADRNGHFESLELYNSVSYAVKNIETGEVIKSDNKNKVTCNARTFPLIGFYQMGIFDSRGNYNPTENVVYDSDKGYAGIKLNTGDSFVLILDYEYDSGYNLGQNHYQGLDCLLSDNGKSEYIEMKLNHEFKWEQFVENSNQYNVPLDDMCFNGC